MRLILSSIFAAYVALRSVLAGLRLLDPGVSARSIDANSDALSDALLTVGVRGSISEAVGRGWARGLANGKDVLFNVVYTLAASDMPSDRAMEAAVDRYGDAEFIIRLNVLPSSRIVPAPQLFKVTERSGGGQRASERRA